MMGWQCHQLNHIQAICTLFEKVTMPAPCQSDFYGPDALPVSQPTATKHWRQQHWRQWHWRLSLYTTFNSSISLHALKYFTETTTLIGNSNILTAVRVGKTQSNMSQPRATHTTRSMASLQPIQPTICHKTAKSEFLKWTNQHSSTNRAQSSLKCHHTKIFEKQLFQKFFPWDMHSADDSKFTNPTPIKYLGFSRGKWSVDSVTIRQNWPFSSPPLRPPIAKPGTSRFVNST